MTTACELAEQTAVLFRRTQAFSLSSSVLSLSQEKEKEWTRRRHRAEKAKDNEPYTPPRKAYHFSRCHKNPIDLQSRGEKPKHKGHVTRTLPTSYGTTSTFQLSVFSFFVYSFFDAELQWKTDNLCGLISVMLRYRPCQASAWLRPLPCLTKIILANLCLLPIAIQHPARERERMDPPEAPYGKS